MTRHVTAGLLCGAILGLPLFARGGGDLCIGSGGVNHYDTLALRLTALTVDGAAQPLPAAPFGGSLSSVASPPGSDFDRATGLVPDFADPTKKRAQLSIRRHH